MQGRSDDELRRMRERAAELRNARVRREEGSGGDARPGRDPFEPEARKAASDRHREALRRVRQVRDHALTGVTSPAEEDDAVPLPDLTRPPRRKHEPKAPAPVDLSGALHVDL